MEEPMTKHQTPPDSHGRWKASATVRSTPAHTGISDSCANRESMGHLQLGARAVRVRGSGSTPGHLGGRHRGRAGAGQEPVRNRAEAGQAVLG